MRSPERIRILALETVDPAKARAEVLDAVKRHGSIPRAAKEAFSVHHKTLYGVIERLGLRADLEHAGIPFGGSYTPERLAGLRNVVRPRAQNSTRKREGAFTGRKPGPR